MQSALNKMTLMREKSISEEKKKKKNKTQPNNKNMLQDEDVSELDVRKK